MLNIDGKLSFYAVLGFPKFPQKCGFFVGLFREGKIYRWNLKKVKKRSCKKLQKLIISQDIFSKKIWIEFQKLVGFNGLETTDIPDLNTILIDDEQVRQMFGGSERYFSMFRGIFQNVADDQPTRIYKALCYSDDNEIFNERTIEYSHKIVQPFIEFIHSKSLFRYNNNFVLK